MAIVTTNFWPNEKFASKINPDGSVSFTDAVDILAAVKFMLGSNADVNSTTVKFDSIVLNHVETQEEVKVRTISEIKEWLRTVPAEGKKLSGEEAALILAKLA